MKIIHLCWMDGAGAGGAAWRLHNGLRTIGEDSAMLVLGKTRHDPLVRVLPEAYFSTNTTCPEYGPPNAPAIARADMRWRVVLSRYPRRSPQAELFTDPFSDVRLEWITDVRNADVVNLHWIGGLVDIPHVNRAFAGKPVVWTMHDTSPFTGGCHYTSGCDRYTAECGMCPNLQSGVLHDVSWHFLRLKKENYCRMALTCVSPSTWLADCGKKSTALHNIPVQVIPNGIPTQIFKPVSRAALRAAHGVPDNARLILFGAAAIQIERKGFAYLRDALRIIAGHNLGVPVWVGIFGSDAGASIDVPFPLVNFGVVHEQEKLAAIYSAADVYALPTLDDNLPNTVLESMACGVPTVGFATGGVPDMVEHGQNGWLAKSRDVEGLAHCLRTAITLSQSDQQTIAANCRARAVAQYDETIQAQAYLALYTKLCENKRAAVAALSGAITARKSGNGSSASAMLDTAEKAFPCLAEISLERGMLLLSAGDTASAIAAFTHSIALQPHNTAAVTALYNIYRGQQAFKETAAITGDCLYVDPDCADIRQLRIAAQETHIDKTISSCAIDAPATSRSNHRVTIILIAWHDETFVQELLADITSQEAGAAICIIDQTPQGLSRSRLGVNESVHAHVAIIRPPGTLSLGQALNLGVRLCPAELYLSCVTGDRLAHGALSMLTTELDAHPESILACGNTVLTDAPHQSFSSYVPSAFHQGIICWDTPHYAAALESLCVGPHVMWRASLHVQWGYFDDRFESGADQALWLLALRSAMPRHIGQSTGLLWLNETVKVRLTKDLSQFGAVRSLFKTVPPPLDAAVGKVAANDPAIMAELGKFIDKLTSLVEKGKHSDAIKLFDRNAGRFPKSPELERIGLLMRRIR